MSMCKTCEGNGYLTNFPFHPSKEIMEEKDPKIKEEKLAKLAEYCKENMSYPCPDCKPLEHKIYKLEQKYDKLERWFYKYVLKQPPPMPDKKR